MYEPQKVYHRVGVMETLRYAVAVWNTFTERQQDNIYNAVGHDYVEG